MPDFEAKMHKIRLQLALRSRPHWGSLQRSPDTLAVFKGPILLRERGGKRRRGRGKRGDGEGKRRGREEEGK